MNLEHKLRELAGQIQKRRMENESQRYRSQEMESWIRHKHLIDLLRGEAPQKIAYPASVPEFITAAAPYTLLLVDAVGYFRHSIGWSELQHERWHENISSRLREVAESMTGTVRFFRLAKVSGASCWRHRVSGNVVQRNWPINCIMN